MNPSNVWLATLCLAACASPFANRNQSPDPDAVPGLSSGCYAVLPAGKPATDVMLPELIELSQAPAPGFVEPGRLAVREPGTAEPKAPLSWWRPLGAGKMELVLGGGYTGYLFTLQQNNEGKWVGDGAYFADFGVEPAPPRLPLGLDPEGCP